MSLENTHISSQQEVINFSDYSFFAVLDEKNIVVNASLVLSEKLKDCDKYELLGVSTEKYKVLQFSQDNSITNNCASIGYVYDEKLNAFIPPKPNPTYLLNMKTYEWEPNKRLEYVFGDDEKRYKWIVSGWVLV